MRYRDLTPEERAEVDRIVQEIGWTGVGTITMANQYKGGQGKRHRLRRAIEERAGFKVDYGIDRDWDDNSRFGWFTRREQISPEQQAARKRLGFA